MSTKLCIGCCVTKPLSEFTPDSRPHRTAKPGVVKYKARCLQCLSDIQKKYRKANPAKFSGYYKKKVNRKSYPDLWWKLHLRKYGITPEQYDAMLASQNGVCAICLLPEARTRNGKPTKLCVDHCHQTGRVRGLLCTRCNSCLAQFGDSAVGLLRVVEYVRAKT